MNEISNSPKNHKTIVESAAGENEEIGKLNLPVNDRDHVQGPKTAAVNLVEYGDYECPYTGQAYPIVKEIQKRLGDKLLFVFRNFPLREIHPHAEHAAEAGPASDCPDRWATEGSAWRSGRSPGRPRRADGHRHQPHRWPTERRVHRRR